MGNLLISTVILTFVFLKWPCVNSDPDYGTDYFMVNPCTRHTVVSSTPICKEIGEKILYRGGMAVDGAIATLICEGVVNPQSSGIGGGVVMTIYERKAQKAYVINGQEHAPAQFSYNTSASNPIPENRGISIGVPGAVAGYWLAYQKFGGGLPWQELFLPSVQLCEEGIPVGKALLNAIEDNKSMFNKMLNGTFVNMNTREQLKYGDKYKNPNLGRSLLTIAFNGGNNFYDAQGFFDHFVVPSMRIVGSRITTQDLKDYEARLEEPLATSIFTTFNDSNTTIYTSNAPTSGPILTYILRLVDGLLPALTDVLSVQRITECIKFAFGARSKMGDPRFANMTEFMNLTSDETIKKIRSRINDTFTRLDHTYYNGDFTNVRGNGTTNVVVKTKNGDVVVASASIGSRFGSKLMDNATGIILNDQMSNFVDATEPNPFIHSQANYIAPGKIPISGAIPSILTDKNGDAILAIAGEGGDRAITGVAISIIRFILFHENIGTTLDNLFHHDFFNMALEYYYDTTAEFSLDLIRSMVRLGHFVRGLSAKSMPFITSIEQ